MKKIIVCILIALTVFSLSAPALAASSVQRFPETEDAVGLFEITEEKSDEWLKTLRSKSKSLGIGLAIYGTIIDDIDSYHYNDEDHEDMTYAEYVTDTMNFAIKGNAIVLFVKYDADTYWENGFQLYVCGKGKDLFPDDVKAYSEYLLNRTFYETGMSYEAVFEDYVKLCELLNDGETLSVPEGEHPDRIRDDAELLTRAEKTALTAMADIIAEENEFDVVVATIGSLGGKESWDYAHDFFINEGYGMGENKDGILLLIAIGSGREGERDWADYTSFGYSDAIFTDSKLDDIEDDMLYYLRKSEWFCGFSTFISGSGAVITADDHPVEKDMDREYYNDYFNRESFLIYLPFLPHTDGIWLIISPVVGIIIAFIILGVMRAKLKSVKFRGDAKDYVVAGSFNLTERSDVFLYNTVTRTVRAESSSSGGGSGGSHSSGGGHSGKF